MYVCIYKYMYIYIYVYMYVYMYVYVYVQCVCMYACLHACMYVCMYNHFQVERSGAAVLKQGKVKLNHLKPLTYIAEFCLSHE